MWRSPPQALFSKSSIGSYELSHKQSVIDELVHVSVAHRLQVFRSEFRPRLQGKHWSTPKVLVLLLRFSAELSRPLPRTCLSQVKVDEVLRLVSHVGAKVAAHDAVPVCVVLLVKFLLNKGSDVLCVCVGMRVCDKTRSENRGNNGYACV